MTSLLEELRKARAEGLEPERAAALLHQKGLTIIETIKIIRQVYSLPLGKAKLIVSSCPEWRVIAQASERLHDEAEKVIEKDPNSLEGGGER